MAAKRETLCVNVKLTERTTSAVPEPLQDLPGIERIVQTFPEETDEELSTLYLVDIDRAKAKKVLRALRSNPKVDYAESPAARKLLR